MGRRGEMPMRIGEVLFGPPFIYKYGVKNISKKKTKTFGGCRKSFYLCTRFQGRKHCSMED